MATTMPQPPAIPPRPTRNQEKGGGDAKAPPKIPPRPTRPLERKISGDRFAPSPLNEGFPKQPKTHHDEVEKADKFSSEPHDPQERPGSVTMPSLGEEGSEYAAVTDEMQVPDDPEQTRTIGGDMKLHAPKPSLPVQSAKQRVTAITRIDSDKAASSFGIGKGPSDTSLATSPRNKKSTTSFVSADEGRDVEEEHGIPEIGQQVPMDRTTGDVQAPSPAVKPRSPVAEKSGKHHKRPDSRGADYYGRHGHGHVTNDRLEKEYYEKHPEELKREQAGPYHERQNEYAMSRNELNEIIRDTADRGSGLGTSTHQGTPSDEVGYQGYEELTSRVTSPRSTGAAKSGLRKEVSPPAADEGQEEKKEAQDEDMIHVDEPRRSADKLAGEERDEAPILAEDEVAKRPARADLHAAVSPPHDELHEPTSRPTSRHASRPASAHKTPSAQEIEATPLEDVKEYEPLFDEDGKEVAPVASPSVDRASVPPRFPSKDVWEDAPSSVHQTTEVNTPDAGEAKPKRAGLPERDILTPAQAFAKHQEELAEKEAKRMTNFVPRGGEKGSSWLPQSAASTPDEREPSPSVQRRFPSRDVWEDAPESHLHQTTVSSRQTPVSPVEQPEVPLRPVRSTEKPAIPSRPKPKKTPSDEVRAKPAVSDKPKPQIPARPARNAALSPEAKEKEGPPPVKPKPAVPARPAGSKIAALQAGFMSDLNKRLQKGPLPPKKEEEEKAAEEERVAEAPKKPLSDARKGRARGPARRAPARGPVAPAGGAKSVDTKAGAPGLAIAAPQVVWSVDPEDGDVLVGAVEEKAPTPEAAGSPPKVVEASPKSESPEVKVPADVSPVEEAREVSKPASVEPEPSIETTPTVVSPKEPSPKEESPEEELPKGESPKEPSPKEESPKEPSPKESSSKEPSPTKPSLKEPSPKEPSPMEELPMEASPKEPSLEELLPVGKSPAHVITPALMEEEPPIEEAPAHVIPAKADLAAVEPLDEDTTEGERLGELQAQAKGRSAEREVDEVETSLEN